jgi:hypothetical protein
MTLKFENPGYVYILSNESLKDLKIGYTQNSPYDRSFDLFTTGVPTPFFVEKFWFVEDAMLCEELIHTRLTRFRTNESREFFRVDLDKAVMAAMQAMDDLRERLWAKNEVKNDYKPKEVVKKIENPNATPEQKREEEIRAAGLKPLVPQFSYNNPKFTAMVKLLKETRHLMTVEDIAKKIAISPKGVDSLIKMMQSQQGAMLYSKEEDKVKKYTLALSFNVHQLTMLAEKYPDLNLLELKPLFEKPAQNNKFPNKNGQGKPAYAPKKDTPATPAEFIKNKLEQESQAASPAKTMSDKDRLVSQCHNAYQKAVSSGEIKESQSSVRKPIRP